MKHYMSLFVLSALLVSNFVACNWFEGKSDLPTSSTQSGKRSEGKHGNRLQSVSSDLDSLCVRHTASLSNAYDSILTEQITSSNTLDSVKSNVDGFLNNNYSLTQPPGLSIDTTWILQCSNMNFGYYIDTLSVLDSASKAILRELDTSFINYINGDINLAQFVVDCNSLKTSALSLSADSLRTMVGVPIVIMKGSAQYWSANLSAWYTACQGQRILKRDARPKIQMSDTDRMVLKADAIGAMRGAVFGGIVGGYFGGCYSSIFRGLYYGFTGH